MRNLPVRSDVTQGQPCEAEKIRITVQGYVVALVDLRASSKLKTDEDAIHVS
jgi:hypothetical protein